MPGFLLSTGATAICAHGGRAQPTAASSRVFVAGSPVTTQPSPYRVSGCPNLPATGGPCATAQWTAAAGRVRASGLPVLLSAATAVCAPTAAPAQVVQCQAKVRGS